MMFHYFKVTIFTIYLCASYILFQNMVQNLVASLLTAQCIIAQVDSFAPSKHTNTSSIYKQVFIESIPPRPISSRQPSSLRVDVASNDIESAVQQASSLAEWQSTAILVVVAGSLGILSQTLINSMLKGDQGLSAFLSDGKGYGNSKFKAGSEENGRLAEDPMPWLRLPNLSFVDIAGQEALNEEELVKKLELLAERGKLELERGDKEKAAETRIELNSLMKNYGFEYKEVQ